MNRRTFLAMSSGVLTALGGCSGDDGRALSTRPTGTWGQRGHDAQNTGTSRATVPPTVERAWHGGDARTAAPLAADGRIFSVAETVTALDAKTGVTEWDATLDAPASRTPALADGAVLVTTEQRLVAFERDGGGKRWSTSYPRPADGALTADSNVVTVPLPDTGLIAYDVTSGERLWRAPLLGANKAALADGAVYATGYETDGETGVLRSFDATSGDRRWSVGLSHPDTPPVVTNDAVLVGDDGAVAVHDPTDGTRRRTLGTFGRVVREPLSLADDTVFVATDSGEIVSLAVSDGTVRWRTTTNVMAGTGMSVGRDAVVAPVDDLPEAGTSGIVALERSDGTPRWEHEFGGFDTAIAAPVILAESAAFYASNDVNGVVALGDPVD